MTIDREKLKSLHFRGSGKRTERKVTTERHDNGVVDIVEHFDDRTDVTIKPDTLRLGGG